MDWPFIQLGPLQMPTEPTETNACCLKLLSFGVICYNMQGFHIYWSHCKGIFNMETQLGALSHHNKKPGE